VRHLMCFYSVPLLHVNLWSYVNSMNLMNKLHTARFFLFVIFYGVVVTQATNHPQPQGCLARFGYRTGNTS
jgi:phosphatidylserine decarboxylase